MVVLVPHRKAAAVAVDDLHAAAEIECEVELGGVVVRFAGNADVPVRSQRKSHSYADEDVRVPSVSPVASQDVPPPRWAGRGS